MLELKNLGNSSCTFWKLGYTFVLRLMWFQAVIERGAIFFCCVIIILREERSFNRWGSEGNYSLHLLLPSGTPPKFDGVLAIFPYQSNLRLFWTFLVNLEIISEFPWRLTLVQGRILKFLMQRIQTGSNCNPFMNPHQDHKALPKLIDE